MCKETRRIRRRRSSATSRVSGRTIDQMTPQMCANPRANARMGRRLRASLVGLLLVAFAAGAPAHAEPHAATEVTIDEVLRLLWEHSPRMQAERGALEQAEAERVAARVLPNPTAGIGFMGILHGANTTDGLESQLFVEQPLLIGGQRAARRRVADIGRRAVEAHIVATFSELAREVRHLFIDLLAAQKRLELMQALRRELVEIERLVVGQHETGVRSRYDVVRTAVERAAFATRKAESRAAVDELTGRLTALLGLPGRRLKAAGELASDSDGRALAEARDGLERRLARLEAARRDEEVARGRLEVARRERIPDLVLGGGAAVTSHDYSTAGFIGVAIDLPVFDRGQGRTAKAEADLQRAGLRRAMVAAEALAELERALSYSEQRRATLETFERGVAERLPEMREMVQEAYLSGQVGILELLDAFEMHLEIELRRLKLASALAHAETAVLASAGLLDNEL